MTIDEVYDNTGRGNSPAVRRHLVPADPWSTGSFSPFDLDVDPFTTEFDGADLLTDHDNVILFRRRRMRRAPKQRLVARLISVVADALASMQDCYDF